MHGRAGPISTRSIGIINCTLQYGGRQFGRGARSSENADNPLTFHRASARRFRSTVRHYDHENDIVCPAPRTMITLERITGGLETARMYINVFILLIDTSYITLCNVQFLTSMIYIYN